MASRTYRPRTAQDETPLRRRASGLALALAANLLLLFVLLGIGAFRPEPQKPSNALVVDLIPESHESASRPARAAEVKPHEVTRPNPVKPRPPKIPPITSPIPSKTPLPMIEMSKDEMAAADVANLPKAGAGSGSEGDSEEVGRGPHGEVLYAAEWARHPTDAELGGYLPKDAPDGAGLIACKTIPGDRVEDCVELANDPPGSHLARAVRLAAWQFRVRPPRKNGRELVGTWVMIRIDYSHTRAD